MTTNVIIVGAGGHGQVVADILLRMADAGANIRLVGYLDDDSHLHGHRILNVPVLGFIRDIENVLHDAIIVAIGDNAVRRQVSARLCNAGEHFINAIHPSAIIAPDVHIGRGVMICANAVVNTGTEIGDNVILNTGCTVDHHNSIGGYAHIAPGVHLAGNVTVDVGSLVGIGSAIIPGKRVGEWSVVAAGAVVTRDVPDLTMVAGVPARFIRRLSLTPMEPAPGVKCK